MHRRYSLLFTLAVVASALLIFDARAGNPAGQEEKKAAAEKKAGAEKKKKAAAEKKKTKKAGAEKKKKTQKQAAKSTGNEELDAEMAAWKKAGTPGKAHGYLKRLVGRWDVKGKFYGEPDSPPIETTGVSNVRMILGGRFIQETYKSKFMGEPFQGIGLTGYDNVKKKYVSVWTDTMMTTFMHMDGEADESGKVLTFIGTFYDPYRKKDIRGRFVLRPEGADRRISESYMIGDDGKETLSMAMVYERAAKKEKKPKKGKGETKKAAAKEPKKAAKN